MATPGVVARLRTKTKGSTKKYYTSTASTSYTASRLRYSVRIYSTTVQYTDYSRFLITRGRVFSVTVAAITMRSSSRCSTIVEAPSLSQSVRENIYRVWP